MKPLFEKRLHLQIKQAIIFAKKRTTFLIQTHAGIPIVDVDILKQHFPGLPDGKLEGKMTHENTNLFFVDVNSLESLFDK